MCFSASASFGASIVLGIAGIVAVKKAKKPSQLFFASIPLIFSAQQFTEGLVWIALNHNFSWDFIPINVFLFFAQIVWPIWIPLSILLIEPEEGHKKALMVFLGFGILIAGYLAWCLMYCEVDAFITSYHIHYELYFPQKYSTPVATIYFLATIIPPFLSTHKRMMLLGLFNFISFGIATLFFEDHVISIWCFFGALISWQIYMVIKDLRNESMGKLNRLVNEY